METVFPGLFIPHNLSKVPILPRPKVREPASQTGGAYHRPTGETAVPQMPDRRFARLPYVGRAVKVESRGLIRGLRAKVPLPILARTSRWYVPSTRCGTRKTSCEGLFY